MIMSTIAKKMKAFTLIELVIFMGLMAIFLTIISSIFIQSLDIQLEAESVSSVEQDGRYILNRLSYDISRSLVINNPSSPGSTSAVLTFTANNIVYTYALSGSNVVFSDSSTSAQVNSYNSTISGLQFIRRGNGNPGNKTTITATFTVTSKIIRENGAETKTFSGTFGTR